MNDDKIRVLVVDDSATMRKLLMQILQQDNEIEVVGTAMNGIFALNKLESLKPDIITLDIEMPQMDGLQFLEEKNKKNDTTPVIILSSLTTSGSSTTMRALELGAKDFILKPSGSISMDLADISEEIIAKVKNWAKKGILKKQAKTDIFLSDFNQPAAVAQALPKATPRLELLIKPSTIKFIAIGISTGGPEALRQILPSITIDLPIVIVQHMPEGFTKDFAQSLSKMMIHTGYTVEEAENGEIIESKKIYIAKGNYHLSISKEHENFVLHLNQDPPVNNHRPSVDYLFSSLFKNIEQNCFIAIIMTGMGKDGAYYLKKLHDRGVFTIAQDEESSIVYGMPKVALDYGAVDIVLSLKEIPEFLNSKLSVK